LATVGVDEGLASDIYESRNKVAHPGSDLHRDDLQRFADHAHVLAHVLHQGIANAIGFDIGEMPEHLPIHAESAFLEMEAIGAPSDLGQTGPSAGGDNSDE
jgi:hypothetical protein